MRLKDMKTRLLIVAVVTIALCCLQGIISSGAMAETRHSFRNSHKNQPKISTLIKTYKIDSELQTKQKMTPGDIIASEKLESYEEKEKDFGVLPPIASKIPKQYHQAKFKKIITTFLKPMTDQKLTGLYGIEVVDNKVFGISKVIVNDEQEHYAKELSLEFEKRYGTPDEKEFFSGEQSLQKWERYVFAYNIIHENRYYVFSVSFNEDINPKRTLVTISLINVGQVYDEFEAKAKANDTDWKEKGDKRELKIRDTIERAFPK
ncbi:MAG: hypothetical protein HQL05_12250 [Nitrospirae bacterium]|uniref:hypothetical protein n=1 Tax=Candidatus Magnetobacterium casense TaxID=1455061 RepID=UPI00058FC1B1|nr:hypothetical protein [Candidatus Magnetobacterium casensis]MBF0338587.1 hypothetical protein [Nitrospirota bacterium]